MYYSKLVRGRHTKASKADSSTTASKEQGSKTDTNKDSKEDKASRQQSNILVINHQGRGGEAFFFRGGHVLNPPPSFFHANGNFPKVWNEHYLLVFCFFSILFFFYKFSIDKNYFTIKL